MDTFPIETFHLLIFTIPGFFIIWSYRKVRGGNAISDFEYLMFSLFWGLILLIVYASIVDQVTISTVLKNPYATAVSFSLLGSAAGWTTAQLPTIKELRSVGSALKEKYKRNI